MPPKEHAETVKPLLGENETAIEMVSTGHESHFLTDKRFFSIKTQGRSGEKTVVDTLQLPLVGGTKIRHERSPDYDEDTVISGAISLLVALFALGISAFVDGAVLGLTVLVGLGVGIMGLILLIEGYNPESGNVTLELQHESGSVIKKIELEEDQLEFAETVSRVVSTTIARPEQVPRTVGN
ncbi:hypothetical protein RBH26_09260 [Natronolimnohabitans sp. A-GB9]|uniref:hypothetical protein n=1 Tax=Natronolimnohabitans sp. A-GB9 TaxID=3069757 RepID=UPI0027B3BA32|nr:hypothetical protein [Natronolimnohabitans sp. A-GB9]MDQ2050675.1 hypothetical protein [Natronolimnohabitans sp. A-GB9]